MTRTSVLLIGTLAVFQWLAAGVAAPALDESREITITDEMLPEFNPRVLAAESGGAWIVTAERPLVSTESWITVHRLYGDGVVERHDLASFDTPSAQLDFVRETSPETLTVVWSAGGAFRIGAVSASSGEVKSSSFDFVEDGGVVAGCCTTELDGGVLAVLESSRSSPGISQRLDLRLFHLSSLEEFPSGATRVFEREEAVARHELGQIDVMPDPRDSARLRLGLTDTRVDSSTLDPLSTSILTIDVNLSSGVLAISVVDHFSIDQGGIVTARQVTDAGGQVLAFANVRSSGTGARSLHRYEVGPPSQADGEVDRMSRIRGLQRKLSFAPGSDWVTVRGSQLVAFVELNGSSGLGYVTGGPRRIRAPRPTGRRLFLGPLGVAGGATDRVVLYGEDRKLDGNVRFALVRLGKKRAKVLRHRSVSATRAVDATYLQGMQVVAGLLVRENIGGQRATCAVSLF